MIRSAVTRWLPSWPVLSCNSESWRAEWSSCPAQTLFGPGSWLLPLQAGEYHGWIASGPQVTECCDAADRTGDGAAADVEASWLAHAVANAVASAVTNHATDRWSTRSITPPPVFRVSGGEGAST